MWDNICQQATVTLPTDNASVVWSENTLQIEIKFPYVNFLTQQGSNQTLQTGNTRLTFALEEKLEIIFYLTALAKLASDLKVRLTFTVAVHAHITVCENQV